MFDESILAKNLNRTLLHCTLVSDRGPIRKFNATTDIDNMFHIIFNNFVKISKTFQYKPKFLNKLNKDHVRSF